MDSVSFLIGTIVVSFSIGILIGANGGAAVNDGRIQIKEYKTLLTEQATTLKENIWMINELLKILDVNDLRLNQELAQELFILFQKNEVMFTTVEKVLEAIV